MRRCISTTRSGHRCLNPPLTGRDFCRVHQSNVSAGKALAIGAGAIIGNAVLPGLGGMVIGGIAGTLTRAFLKETATAKKVRVFVSFDFDNDRVLKDFILGQAKSPDSPFDVVDHSLKEAAPERNWEEKARTAISHVDIVLVMVGPQTCRAHGVLKEVAMARKAGIKTVQIIGYKDRPCPPVPDAGRLYAWNWDNLKKLLT